MIIADIDSNAFPSLSRSIRANWAPIYLSPLRGSEERLVIGVAVFNEVEFHIEAANSLSRLQCLYEGQADIVIQVAGIALDDLKYDMAARSREAIRDFRPSVTGISLGDVRDAE